MKTVLILDDDRRAVLATILSCFRLRNMNNENFSNRFKEIFWELRNDVSDIRWIKIKVQKDKHD